MRAAVFFDRDGVVNELVPDPVSGLPESPLHPDDVLLVSTAPLALRALREAGFLLVGISNQPAAAKGTVTLEELERVHRRVVELLAEGGARPDAFYLCFHHPEGIVPALTGECDCRKPAPGLILQAAREFAVDLGGSWMVGDTAADVAAGRTAGCRTVLVEHPGSAHKRLGARGETEVASSLADAAARLIVPSAR